MVTRTSWLVLNTSSKTASNMMEKTYDLYCEMFPTSEMHKWEQSSQDLYFDLYLQVRTQGVQGAERR